ncbi:MAG: DUF1707 domain-containing protein [Acidimicrobiales bacterium]
MSEYNVPPWSSRSSWRRQAVPPSQMRVSDAERHQIVDALSKHFADGRLDQAEFDERMGKAMSAKTQGDLVGLLADLPPLHNSASEPRRRRQRSRGVLLLVGAAVLFLLATGPWGWGPWPYRSPLPFLVLVFLAVVLFRRARWGWHHHHSSDDELIHRL